MIAPVFLIGFMGAGKSEVGRLLANALGCPFVDLDVRICEDAGLSVPEIFAREGEDGFRARESRALREVAAAGPAVVACGGGVVVTPANREFLLAQPWVFRLRVSAETVFQRVGADPNRPLLRGADPLARIRQLMAEREAWYALFPRQVETDGFRASEVAAVILSELRKSATDWVKRM